MSPFDRVREALDSATGGRPSNIEARDAAIAALAEIEAAFNSSYTEQEYNHISALLADAYTDLVAANKERDELRAKLAEYEKAPTVAHMRRWAFDGVKPAKERNANGRLAWPARFRILPVTTTLTGGRGVFDDDVELIARPTRKDGE